MIDEGLNLFDAFVVDPLRAALSLVVAYVPKIIGAIIVLAIGWWIAKLIERLVIRVLKIITLDKIADQVHLSNALAKGGIRRKLSELIGAIIYWIVILAFVMTAFNVLGLAFAANLLQEIVGYLPNVIAALFILIIGVFAAAFLAAAVRTAASSAGILQAHLLGQLVQTAIIVFAAVTALGQLKVEFFGHVFLIILGGLSLGAGLAFGLGCKDLAGKWVGSLIDQMQGRKR